MTGGLDATVRRAEAWLTSAALPLWSTHGFDAEAELFEERLTFAGEPVIDVPRRLMVQCRQISVYAAASLSGRFPQGSEIAGEVMRRTIASYLRADGAPGWVFAIDREGRPVDGRRDLYAHAFALFALAWAQRIDPSSLFMEAIDETLAFLDRSFADHGYGGYWDCLPRPDALRRQNPHMHLFEALIALHETTSGREFIERGRCLRDLAVLRFLDPKTGALREYFDDRWRVHPAPGQGSVEPGHLYEWAWLLRRWQFVSGDDQSEAVRSLLRLADTAGLDPTTGRIVDEIGEDGTLRRSTSRSWPHAEALKSLTTETRFGHRVPDETVDAILSRLLDVYCRADLRGGWIDHVDEEDRPLSKVMPASTLYHLYFGMTSVTDRRVLDKFAL